MSLDSFEEFDDELVENGDNERGELDALAASYGFSLDQVENLNVEEIAELVEQIRNEILESSAASALLKVWNMLSDEDKVKLYTAGAGDKILIRQLMPIFNTRYNNLFLKTGIGDFAAPLVRSMVMVGLVELPNQADFDVHADALKDKNVSEWALKLVGYIPTLASYKTHLALLSKVNIKLHEVKIEVARNTQARAA